MEPLTTLDAGLLEAGGEDPHESLAIGALAVMEGPLPDHDSLLEVLTKRMQTVRRLRQVLRTYPFGLAPRWVDDADFDVSHHIHRTAVPHPGDDAALFGLVADVMSWRLHRDRPLWECWVIEGISNDRWAILMKVHQCIADEIIATPVLARLFDECDGETFVRPDTTTSSLDPLKWLGRVWHSSLSVIPTAARVIEGAMEIADGVAHPVPSFLTGRVTSVRRYAAVEVALEDVAKVCRALDVTIKDVALAAMSDSYRTLLVRRGERAQYNSLRALVSVNRESVLLPYLPVDKSDPMQQLQAAHSGLIKANASLRHHCGSFVSAAKVVPFPLMAFAVRALARLPRRGVVALATYEAGPRRRMRIMGRDIVRLLPIPPIGLGLRTGVAMTTYADSLVFGVTADYDAVPDVAGLAESIEHAVARLVAISAAARRSNGKGTLYLMPKASMPKARPVTGPVGSVESRRQGSRV